MAEYIGISKPLQVVDGNYASLDAKYGPYDSVNHAISSIPITVRRVGLTVGIIFLEGTVETVKDYWWKKGIEDTDLELKVDNAASTKTSQLENDADFQSGSQVSASLQAQKNILDAVDVNLQGQINTHESQINNHSSQIQDIITSYIDNKGYFATLTSLQTSYPTPEVGDTAYVADALSSTGYYIYNVVGGAWTASTVEAPPVSVPISNYAEHGYTGTPKTLKTVEDEKASDIAQLAGIDKHKVYNLSQAYSNFAYPTKSSARLAVVHEDRNLGQILIYKLSSGEWVREYYTGLTTNQVDYEAENNWRGLSPERSEYYNISQISGIYNFSSKSTARATINRPNRAAGAIITYQMSDGKWITERYLNTSQDQPIWELDANWETIYAGSQSMLNISFVKNNYAFASRPEARLAVDYKERNIGQIITYQLATGEWVVDHHIGTSTDAIYWYLDTSWERIWTSNNLKFTEQLGGDSGLIVSQDLLSRTLENKAYLNYRKVLYSGTTQKQVACAEIDGEIYDIYSNPGDTLIVSKNGSDLASIQQYNIGSIAVCYHSADSLLHILTSNAFHYPDTYNKLNHYTFNPVENSLIYVNSLDFGLYRKQSLNLIEFNGYLYTAISYVSTNGTFQNDQAIVELYKVENSGFTKISDIATPDDIWGHKFDTGTNIYYSLTKTGYFNATLCVNDGKLYCTFVGTPLLTAHTSKYLVFEKETTDLLNWKNNSIHSNLRSYSAFAFHYQNERIVLAKAYKNNTFTYAVSELVFALNGTYNRGFLSLSSILSDEYGAVSNEYYSLTESDEYVHIISSFKFLDGRSNTGIIRLSLKKKDVYESLKGSVFNDKGSIDIMNPNRGDSYILSKQGLSEVPIFTFPFSGATLLEYAELGKNEKVRLTYQGSDMGWIKNTIQSAQSRKDTIPFEHNAQNNPWFSGMFRIPTIAESADGNILFAFSDIRYTRGDDFDIIEVGFARSFDNGETWQDYKKIFERDEFGDYSNRIHDCTTVVDNNPNSSHYGRIWAFAKMWTSDMTDMNDWGGVRYIKLYVCYSDDKGETWSAQQDVSSLIPSEWLSFSGGCNTGLTLQDGTLVLPFYVSKLNGTANESYSTFLYSTDGEIWQLGDIVPTVSTNENSIIQKEDGTLIMNSRNESVAVRKVHSLSAIGNGWVYEPTLSIQQTVICQECLAHNRGIYLYSQPEWFVGNGGMRKNITLFKSKDLINWEKIIQLTNYQSAGYSNIIFNDNRIGIIYEGLNYDMKFVSLDYLQSIIYK